MIADTRNSIFWKSIEYAFYLFFVTFPFVYYGGFLYSGTSTRALNLIVVAAVSGIAFAVWLWKKGNTVALAVSPLLLALAAYLGFLTVSGILGLDFSTTFWSVATRMTGIWYFLSLGFFMLLLWVLITDEKRHHRLILGILLSTALYSVADLLSTEGFGILFGNRVMEAFTFGNTSFAAMYIFGAFMLSLYYLFQSETKKWWMYLLPVILVINPIILNKDLWFGDFSRGILGQARATSSVVFLSILVLFSIWLIAKIRDTRTRSRVSYSLFGISLLLVVLSSFSLLSPNGYLRAAYLASGTAARPLVWEMSGNAIGERSVFGWGADNFERVFERQYDNRLLQEEYGNEAWFDRAHNVVIDQLVDNGFVGLALYFAVYLAAVLALLYTALNAEAKRDRIFASVLIAYFPLHLIELQTAFDTSISYPMLAFLFVSAAVLFHRAWAFKKGNARIELNAGSRYAISAVLAVFFSWSLFAGALPFAQAQLANGEIRTIGSAQKRIPLYPALFASPVDVHAFLWRTSTDFQRGIAQNPQVLEDPEKVQYLKEEVAIFEQEYRDYVKENSTNFRAHLNLADILIYQMLFGIDKLENAHAVLDEAIALVPQSPQPYWMKAVAYVYMRRFDLAREYAKKGLMLNPKIKQSQEIVEYVERSAGTFPEIDLFFFKQI